MKYITILIMTVILTVSAYATYNGPVNADIIGKVTQLQKWETLPAAYSGWNQTNCTSANDITKVVFITIEISETQSYQFWIDENHKTTIALATLALNSNLDVNVQTDGMMDCLGNVRLTIINIKQ